MDYAARPTRFESRRNVSGVRRLRRRSLTEVRDFGLRRCRAGFYTGLLQYLEGSAKRPGLWMMGHLAEPVRLMIDMEKMGIKVTTAVS